MSTKITQVNIYQREGLWCYAAFTDAEYDHSDVLDVDASEGDARAAATSMFPDARVRYVDDV